MTFARLRRHSTALIVALLVALPVLVKAPLLAGLLVSDPVTLYAGIETERSRGLTAGGPTVDPNIGYTSHALGSYAARELVAGRLPWWNPYEGVGTPLAAGMQSAALFPLLPVLLLPRGQMLFHLLLQIIGGLAAFGLLRALKLGRGGAAAGAVAFEFNAVFAWMANAVVNPVAFLPLILWGVEWQRADDRRRPIGIAMIAIGLALSLYAGFPEVAYLNGLLVAAWSGVRIVGATAGEGGRLATALRIGLAGLAGVLLAAPAVVPFLAYLPQAELGMHGGEAAHFNHLAPGYGLLALLPYFIGGIFQQPIVEAFWGNVGGYAGMVLLAVGIAGTFGRRERALRLTLAGWIVVSFALTFGASWLFVGLSWIPGIAQAALYRYLPASWIMALVVLAAFALDDLRRGADRRPVVRATAATAALALVLLAAGHGTIGWHPRDLYAWAATLPQLALFVAFAAIAVWPRFDPGLRAALAGAVLVLEGLWLFTLPVLAHPRHMRVEAGGVRFLQQHLGYRRFVTLGPISPNYGSYFGIAQANHNDLPAPKLWTDYARRHLDPETHPILFTRISSPPVMLDRLPAYAEAGIGYAVAPAGMTVPGLPRVYADPLLAIYRLPGTAPYMAAAGCAVTVASREAAVADCPRPARLVRRELAMPGWRARVSGRDTPVARSREIFQTVDLPAGRHDVVFSYRPPHIAAAAVLAALGVGLLAGLTLWPRRWRRRVAGRKAVVS